MSTINDAKLLEINRNMQIDALRDAGIPCPDGAGFGYIAELMEGAGGCALPQIGAIEKSTGRYVAFTQSEYDSSSATVKSKFIVIGMRLIIEGHDFTITRDDHKRISNNSYTFVWATENVNVDGLTDWGAIKGLWDDFDAETQTTVIAQYAPGRSGQWYAAHEIRENTKGCTLANDGLDDPTVWSMPTVGIMHLLHKHRNAINTALNKYSVLGFKPLTVENYWCVNEIDNSGAFRVHLGSGLVARQGLNGDKDNYNYRVRPVSVSITYIPFGSLSL